MSRNQFKRSVNEQLVDTVADGIDNINRYENELQADSENYYRRRLRDRFNERRQDIFILIGVYLVLCSVAFVIL